MMSLNHKLKHIYTAHYRYSGDNRVDITVKGKHPVWQPFAPTWDMVMGVKNLTLSEEEYIMKYLGILQKVPINTWNKLLSMEEVVFVCFCNEQNFCHRNILTNFICQTLQNRVVYMGWK